VIILNTWTIVGLRNISIYIFISEKARIFYSILCLFVKKKRSKRLNRSGPTFLRQLTWPQGRFINHQQEGKCASPKIPRIDIWDHLLSRDLRELKGKGKWSINVVSYLGKCRILENLCFDILLVQLINMTKTPGVIWINN